MYFKVEKSIALLHCEGYKFSNVYFKCLFIRWYWMFFRAEDFDPVRNARIFYASADLARDVLGYNGEMRVTYCRLFRSLDGKQLCTRNEEFGK